MAKPFLKWAGGKYRLLSAIKESLSDGERLVEPFVGAGSVFMNCEYKSYWINDSNPDLINLYQYLSTDTFLEDARAVFTPENATKERYLELREEFNQTVDPYRKSILFLYLNKHCFNGVCRYNSKGKFNVPHNKVGRVGFPETELQNAQSIFQTHNIKITNVDFRDILAQVEIGDVVYCDPPYYPKTETGFVNYDGFPFSKEDQLDLANFARAAAERGAVVLISNHDLPETRKLYHDAEIKELDVRRSINCKGGSRGTVPELIAKFC